MLRNIRILEDVRTALRYIPPVHFSSRDFDEFCGTVPTARKYIRVTFSDTRYARVQVGRRTYYYAFYPSNDVWGWHRTNR